MGQTSATALVGNPTVGDGMLKFLPTTVTERHIIHRLRPLTSASIPAATPTTARKPGNTDPFNAGPGNSRTMAFRT
jgi:hypothetical protein